MFVFPEREGYSSAMSRRYNRTARATSGCRFTVTTSDMTSGAADGYTSRGPLICQSVAGAPCSSSTATASNRDRLMSNDPSDGVTLPRLRKSEHSMEISTPDQVRAILEAADDWFRPYIALCAFAGLRLGEASAMRVTDVDFLRRTIGVRRQVQRATGDDLAAGHAVSIVPPKYGSERDVFVPDELTTIIAWHVKHVGVRGEERWLFVGDGGMPPHANSIVYWWKKTTTKAGVEGVKLHDLRHYFASGLIAAGCSVATVQRALGHSSPSITLNTYTHLWPTAEDHTRKAAGAMMRAAMTAPADYSRTEQG